MRRPRRTRPADQSPARAIRGTASVEVMLTLVVLVLAVWLGVDLVGRYQHRRRCDRFIADLHSFSAAIRRYERQTGRAAPAAPDGRTLPAGLEQALRTTPWNRGSPFGGTYRWMPADAAGLRDAGDRGVIALTAFSPQFPLALTRADLVWIDARIDDGNLATGRLRAGFNGWPVYVPSGP